MLKNIDKCGLYKDFEGKISFSQKISNPKQKSIASVGVVRTSKDIKNETPSEPAKIETSKKIDTKRKYKTTSAFNFNTDNGITQKKFKLIFL